MKRYAVMKNYDIIVFDNEFSQKNQQFIRFHQIIDDSLVFLCAGIQGRK